MSVRSEVGIGGSLRTDRTDHGLEAHLLEPRSRLAHLRQDLRRFVRPWAIVLGAVAPEADELARALAVLEVQAEARREQQNVAQEAQLEAGRVKRTSSTKHATERRSQLAFKVERSEARAAAEEVGEPGGRAGPPGTEGICLKHVDVDRIE